MVKIEEITAVGAHTLLEGPHWDIARQSLYFNDILEGRIFRYDYQENKVYEAAIDGFTKSFIGFIVPVQGKSDEFIVAVGPKLLEVKWDGLSATASVVKIYAEVDKEIGRTRFNDGKVDPRGRIFSGTMRAEDQGDIFEQRLGTFYRVENGIATGLRKNLLIANGLAWVESTNKFYYVDSGDLNLKEYDYNADTGEISNEKIVLEIPKDTYVLDGMTLDDNGLLYIACFLGGKFIVVDPAQKKIINEIVIPDASQVTSVAFGGPNLDELFVTTAGMKHFPGPNGKMFKVTGLGVKGTRMYDAKI